MILWLVDVCEILTRSLDLLVAHKRLEAQFEATEHVSEEASCA